MANVVSRSAPHRYLRSVNEPDYPQAQWIWNPDMSAVAGYPSQYWTISGDTVSLMSQAERDAVDAARLEAEKDAVSGTIDGGMRFERAFALVILDEINALRERAGMPLRTLAQLRAAIRSKL